MENPVFEENQSIWPSPVDMIHLIWLGVVPDCAGSAIHRFISESNSFLKTLIPLLGNTGSTTHHPVDADDADADADADADDADTDDFVHGHEVGMLMDNLGLPCDPEGEAMKKKMGSREISRIFEDREPSIEELRAAFEVFDENRDGFIDAYELKRVIEILGIRNGCDLEACKRMIRAFDLNGDDRIDSDEFFRFMSKTLC